MVFQVDIIEGHFESFVVIAYASQFTPDNYFLGIMNSKLSKIAIKAPGAKRPRAVLDNFIELDRGCRMGSYGNKIRVIPTERA